MREEEKKETQGKVEHVLHLAREHMIKAWEIRASVRSITDIIIKMRGDRKERAIGNFNRI
jgi:hypothetical protein